MVYPLQNRQDPPSLWSVLYPRTKMRWEWDVDGDDRVGELWRLREELSRSDKVVYAKWYQGRATFFSKNIFTNLLAYLGSSKGHFPLSRSSQEALESFLLDSPQSTKLIKENLGWQGKLMESHYNRAMKPLWAGLFVVGYGEEDDSSFPSLRMAATQNLFEELWLSSQELDELEAEKNLKQELGEESLFWKHAQRIKQRMVRKNL